MMIKISYFMLGDGRYFLNIVTLLCVCNKMEIESLNKRTNYDDEDALDNFCPSARYLAHTEVSGGCSTITGYRFMARCL